MKMIDVNYVDYAYEAYMRLSYSEIDHICALLQTFKRRDLPEEVRDKILPKMEDFLLENYWGD